MNAKQEMPLFRANPSRGEGAEPLRPTLVRSLCNLGYKSTTAALCQFVENAIQWGANEARVYIDQIGKDSTIQSLVLDNGQGMDPDTLRLAMSLGGSLVDASHGGVGRYGLGMKAAALHLGHVLDVYSWQAGAIHEMTLDVDDLRESEPRPCREIPAVVADLLLRPTTFPKRPNETQRLFAKTHQELRDRLGDSGTIVYLPDCGRLGRSKPSVLVDHATKEMGRIFRRAIDAGLKLYVNNRRIEAFDPMYAMKSARHSKIEGLTTRQSRLVNRWQIDVPVEEGGPRKSRVEVKLYRLPIEEWSGLPRKVLHNDLRVDDGPFVSFMRDGREIACSDEESRHFMWQAMRKWLRFEIDFKSELDDAFGVASNKQEVRPRPYVVQSIVRTTADDLKKEQEEIHQVQTQLRRNARARPVGDAERRATEAEPLQATPLPAEPLDPKLLEQCLRGLAIGLRREGESDTDALERLQQTNYITRLGTDPGGPFYQCEYQFGRVILTINTAHPFYRKLWEPLSELARRSDPDREEDDVARTCEQVLASLQLLFLSLARTHAVLGEDSAVLEKLRRVWSSSLATQLR